jgi:hypothetical protein
MATSRPRRVSRARYTSPIPPAPTSARISYGPSLVPRIKGVASVRFPAFAERSKRGSLRKLPARSSSINSCSTRCFNSGSSWQAASRNARLASGAISSASPNNFSTDCLCWPIFFPSDSNRTNCPAAVPPSSSGVRISYWAWDRGQGMVWLWIISLGSNAQIGPTRALDAAICPAGSGNLTMPDEKPTARRSGPLAGAWGRLVALCPEDGLIGSYPLGR